MMSERWGSTFAALLHGKNFKPKWQSILLGRNMQRNFSADIHYAQFVNCPFFYSKHAQMSKNTLAETALILVKGEVKL